MKVSEHTFHGAELNYQDIILIAYLYHCCFELGATSLEVYAPFHVESQRAARTCQRNMHLDASERTPSAL
jgi:hypothetical protein